MNAAPRSDDDGLNLDELRLVPSDPAWPEKYQKECDRLSSIPHVIAVEHIGSTVFPDIQSKPVIDIAVLVDTQPDHPLVRKSFAHLGYSHHGEYGLPGRIFYTYGEPPKFHVHVVTCGSTYWADWLTFRDFLLHHPEWRKQYEQVKLRIFDDCHGDRHTYTEMKSPFIMHVLHTSRSPSNHE